MKEQRIFPDWTSFKTPLKVEQQFGADDVIGEPPGVQLIILTATWWRRRFV